MRRGFAAVKDSGGRLVRSVKEVRGGEQLTLRMADGTVEAEATRVLPEEQ